jgi:hypothetical protein
MRSGKFLRSFPFHQSSPSLLAFQPILPSNSDSKHPSRSHEGARKFTGKSIVLKSSIKEPRLPVFSSCVWNFCDRRGKSVWNDNWNQFWCHFCGSEGYESNLVDISERGRVGGGFSVNGQEPSSKWETFIRVSRLNICMPLNILVGVSCSTLLWLKINLPECI